MTISKAKSTYSSGEKLDKSTLSQVDYNISSCLDKRADKTDTLGSIININSGTVSFGTGSVLNINPSVTSITSADGYILKTGAEISGDYNQNDPLRFGFQTINLTSTNTTLSAAQLTGFNIRFTTSINPGILNITVIFPTIEGYTKLIDNQTNYDLRLKTDAGTVLILKSKNVQLVYCDGTDIKKVSDLNSYTKVDERFDTSGSTSPGSTISYTTSSTYNNIISFLGPFDGLSSPNFFEVELSGLISSYGSGGAAGNNSELVVAYYDGNIYNILYETSISSRSTSLNFIGTDQPYDNNWTFMSGMSKTIVNITHQSSLTFFVFFRSINGSAITATGAQLNAPFVFKVTQYVKN